jgi:alanine dehydrogenase
MAREKRPAGDWKALEAKSAQEGLVLTKPSLPAPRPMLKTDWIKPGALVMPYGTMSAVELSLTDIMDKVVVDDWGQCRAGLPFGALRQHVDSGRLHEGNLHAELGHIVAGRRSGREAERETILLLTARWKRGIIRSLHE